MDTLRSIETDEPLDEDYPPADEPHADVPPAIGTDERRMHVRAYNYWVSLLKDQPYPSIEDLDPAGLEGFGPHSVLLDFTADPENPALAYLGRTLREEGEIGHAVTHIDQVPSGSLLSRLTDHYLQIIANRAPIGFEAEFVNRRGGTTLYRGILLPFSSNGDQIDFVYGVINWKEVADPALTAGLAAEMNRALREAPAPSSPIWADGPQQEPAAFGDIHGGGEDFAAAPESDSALPDDAGLGDRLAAAREHAETARTAAGRSRAALYRALGLAYDFALAAEHAPEDYAELLADAGLKRQKRAPMTPVVKLVFGADYDKTRLTEFAAALARGRRLGLGVGALRGFLENHTGGLKGVVAAERQARRAPSRPDPAEKARERLRAAPSYGSIQLAGSDPPPGSDAEFLLLVARREQDGSLAVLVPIVDKSLVARAIRRA